MKYTNILNSILAASLLYLGACKPNTDEEKDLPSPATASFDITRLAETPDDPTGNTYIINNTTPGAFVTRWDFDGGAPNTTNSYDTLFLAYAGEYDIKLTTASKGGITTAIQKIVVEETSPFAAAFEITQIDPYNYTVTMTTPTPRSLSWLLPTGETSTEPSVSFYWPFQDTASVSLSVVASNGRASTQTQQIMIESNDPANPWANDPIMTALTGGPAATGKTWVLFRHGGVGPMDSGTPDWWSNPDLGKASGDVWEQGALANEYTFKFDEYQYIPKNTNTTVNWLVSDSIFGIPRPQDQDIAIADPAIVAAPYVMEKVENPLTSGYKLTITKGSYMGYGQNRSEYEILRFSDNGDTLFLRQGYDDADPSNMAAGDDFARRYFSFVVKK